MSETADLLRASHAAHRDGKQALKRRNRVAASAAFLVALNARLKARASDPGYTDPAWGQDLDALQSRKAFDTDLGRRLHVKEGESEPEGYDTPSKRVSPDGNTKALLAKADTDLEAYYRHQLGDSANTHSQVDLKSAATAIKVPDAWVTTVAGVKTMAPATGLILTCNHTFQRISDTHRRCLGCTEEQQLQPTMALEDTDAFKQLQREAAKVQ